MGVSDELGLNSMVLVTDMCIVSGILLHRFFRQANWAFYFLSYETCKQWNECSTLLVS